MYSILTILLLLQQLSAFVGVSAISLYDEIEEEVQLAERAVTYAATCTYYNTIVLLSTSLTSSTCVSPTISGPYVTQNCYTGLNGVLGTTCSAATTATTCVSTTVTSTSVIGISTTVVTSARLTVTTAVNLGTQTLTVALAAGLATTSTIPLGFTTVVTTITGPAVTTTVNLGLSTSTATYASQTCGNAVFPPVPLTAAAGTTCYADNVNGVRALSGASTTSSSLTNAACKTYCTNLGYAYSGTEYSSECYCGNTLPTTLSTMCTMACSLSGSTEICGGPNALSVSVNSAIALANSQASAVFATWTSQGCYSDSYPTRVLSAASTTATSVTLESCVSFCNTGGYLLAGVEYGQECYCANSIRSDGATYGVAGQAGCTYACAGNRTEICGGSNVLNLYSKNSAVAIAAAAVPSPATASGYSYLGCYSDTTSSRTLAVTKSTVNSVEACVSVCSTGGYKYAGLEYYGECWCDNTIRGGAAQIAGTSCLYTCTGNASETCGGSSAIQIYSGSSTTVTIPASAGGYTYLNTYTDSGSARTLANQQMLSSNTVINCIYTCSNLGYTYAGLEYGSQCFCGSALSNNPTAGQTPNVPCSGNATQFCGGNNLIQVYSGTSNPQYLTTPFTNGQCVADNVNNARTLPVAMTSTTSMTPAACRSACTGYKYYGVEYGQECWCGNAYASGSVLSYSCGTACAGDNTQICGGSYAMNIYAS